jgi:hypothetical protein
MTINTAFINGEEVPVYTVAHLTDITNRSDRRRAFVLSRQYYRTKYEAETAAFNASTTVLAPQRFTVYAPDLRYVSSWQAGQPLPAFTVEGEA